MIVAQQIGAWLYPFLNPVAADGWLGVAVQTAGVLGILVALVVLVALLGPPGSGPSTRLRVRDAGSATPPEDQADEDRAIQARASRAQPVGSGSQSGSGSA